MQALAMRLGPWRVERTLGRDLSGTYFAGRRDDGERATLYLLSEELSAAGDEPLIQLLELHRSVGHPGLVPFHGLDHDGSDRFLIAGAIDDALAPLRSGPRPGSGQILAFGAALAAALVAAHDRGLIHGGLELDNTLWAPDRAPQILGTGVAALGIADRVALAHGDVAALGRLLCTLAAGWRRRGAGGAAPGRTAGGDRTVELVRRIADPGAAISMREAHALLAAGGPIQTTRSTGRVAEPHVAGELHPRAAGDRAARASASTGTAETTELSDRTGGGASGAGAATPPKLDHPRGHLGRYRILTCLGRGGMGEVFLAEDPVLRRGVAIKRIRPGLDRDRTFRIRLRREAQFAARLSHRAIVQVFDLVTEDNVDHVVMEYVPGPSLHTLLAGSPMAVTEVVRIAAELADGLAYAHQQGIVHRDLKVENILISIDGQPKIADFGIARRTAAAGAGTAQEPLTGEGFLIGTARAMSPEQIQGHDVDARSDLFSFGILLYELVTGTSPFASGADAVTIMRVLHDRQPPACELVPELPRALSDLIDHLLEKAPAQRPDDARTVRDRLRRILDGSPAPRTEARTAAPPAEPSSGLRSGGVPASATAGGERRQVTLACIELVAAGGAEDGELTDPEPLADVLPAFRERVDEILARFDGLLISALGHRFVACFGHPRPLEDAARRAVLAGRALLDAAAELRSADPVHTRVSFTASGAVHTGLAVVRGRGAGEELVLGATLDAALRLLQLGGAGNLWLGETTARLVEAELELDRPAALPEGGTSARRFAGTRVPAGAGTGEHDRPMVARDHEMQLLLGAWRRVRQGQGQVALLIGEPGIGKSRLTRALAGAIAGDEPRRIVLRGSAYRQRSALEPVAEAVAALLGIGRGAQTGAQTGVDPAADLTAAAERIRALTGPDEAEQVGQLLGRAASRPAEAPERARHQLLGGLRDVLVGSHDTPTLIVVEDLHWLDPSTLDLIALIIRDVAASPVFLVMTTRPGFSPPWPAAAAVTQLHLGRLEAPAIEAVITHACAGRALPDAERKLIAARCEGVPLYAQELVRAALELGRAGEVPSTLRDALSARLHQLGPSATEVARVAAVAGREFTPALIAAAAGLDQAAVDRELDRLVTVEILIRRRGRAREPLYQFGHVLLQQAAYDELLAADRRQLHGQLADALLADARAGKDPGPEVMAHHLAGARRFDEAVASAQHAALRALGRHARVEARELLRQALGWLDQLPASGARDRSEIGLRMQLGAVLISTEGYTSPELERSCGRTEALCARHDDMPLPVKYGLWAVRLMRGSPEEVEPFLGWFEQVIDRGGPPVERMMAHASIATYAYVRARYERASHHLERGMALFAPAEHAGVVQSYGGCGGFYSHIITIGVLWQTGRLDEAWRHARATVVQAEALDPYALASALGYEMSLHLAAGDVAQTEALADRMLELATRYEFPYMICSALCHRGWALARRGQAERAMTDLVMATEGTRRMGVKVWYPYFLGLYADSAIALGQWDHAARALDEALEVSRTSVDCGNEPELLRLRGQLILGRDASAHAPARAAFADALAVAQRRGALTAALRTATDLAALLRDDHLPGEALAVLDPVYRGFAPGLDDRNLAAARQLLAELPAGPA
jgi:tetratricopeptide (TPR) repeat protein/plasmid stabilization system protein ParE